MDDNTANVLFLLVGDFSVDWHIPPIADLLISGISSQLYLINSSYLAILKKLIVMLA